MFRLFAVVIVLLASMPFAGAEIYRWTDDAGNVIFSDTPRPGAELIELSEPTILPAQPTPGINPDDAEARPVARPYRALRITRPANETTIRNTRTVQVSVAVQPGLQSAYGHKLQLLLDGQPASPPGARMTFTLDDVDRGAHTLQAVIVNADGSVVERSEASQFFVHQATAAGRAR